MRLMIDNFAKIKHADIAVDGITVIAGKNNSGKSTIGKVLYSIFNSLYDLNVKIEKQRKREIQEICERYTFGIIMHSYSVSSKRAKGISFTGKAYESIIAELVEDVISMETEVFNASKYRELFLEKCRTYDVELDDELVDNYVENVFDKIESRKQKDNYKIALELIERFFIQIFGSQVQCLKELDKEAKIGLTIKAKDISVKFAENRCIEYIADYNILHEAFFLDDPFVLDEMNEYSRRMTSTRGIRGQLVKKLCDAEKDIMSGLFDAIDAKETLQEIEEILNGITEGEILSQNGQWGLNAEQYGVPVNFENLSAGLKSFVLLKLLLEKGILKEKDVLILDEPEIHLHPEWQLSYAEIIVLLQKKFDLNIIVTTHSMHFLEAIEYYSKKYKIEDKCKYYMTNLQNGLAIFHDVTLELDKIYREMVTPNMLLDQLKYELVNEDE